MHRQARSTDLDLVLLLVLLLLHLLHHNLLLLVVRWSLGNLHLHGLSEYRRRLHMLDGGRLWRCHTLMLAE